MPDLAPATAVRACLSVADRLARRYLSDALGDLRLPADRDHLASSAAGMGVQPDPVLLDAAADEVDRLVTAWRAQLADPTPHTEGARRG